MECIPGGGLGCEMDGGGASVEDMEAPRRAAASSAEEGGAWGLSCSFMTVELTEAVQIVDCSCLWMMPRSSGKSKFLRAPNQRYAEVALKSP